jgi:hypothetical protein
MPGVLPQGVFLSYRREDAGPYARSLQLQLTQRMPGVPVFIDMDSIEAGLDFAEVIEDAVRSCAVLVALIGRQWATLTDEDGHRRLDNPDDYVRFEVQAALERGIRVIPVLIDGAKPLRQQQLPTGLHKLARLNAHKLSYDRYQDDADRLLDLIQRVLAKVAEEEKAGGQGPGPRNWTNSNDDLALARSAWGKFSPRAKALFSLLMDQPGRKVSGKDLASTLDIPNGAAGVAGVLAWPARHCAAVNRVGPWRWEYRSEEDKTYYWIDPEVASLFQKVRN